MNYRFAQLGFTVIEVLIVIGIFGILAAIGLFFSMDFFRTYSTNSEQVTLVSALSQARAQSLANINRQPHGVRVTPENYTIFSGSSFDTRDQSFDRVLSVSSAVHPSGTTDIVFEQLSGNTSCTEICNITLTGASPVQINAQGAILW
jgi:prepilin-type N-terminal cleavage/methylation domain-containing protein